MTYVRTGPKDLKGLRRMKGPETSKQYVSLMTLNRDLGVYVGHDPHTIYLYTEGYKQEEVKIKSF